MLSASPVYWSYMAALCLSAALSLILIGYVWPRRSAAGAQPLLGLLVSVIFWSVGYIMEYASTHIDAKLLAMDVSYIGVNNLKGGKLAAEYLLMAAMLIDSSRAWKYPRDTAGGCQA